MKTKSITIAFGLVTTFTLATGCVSERVTMAPSPGVDLRQYKTVKLNVTDEVNTPYSKASEPMFEGLLKGKLQSLGYTPTDSSPDLTLDVRIYRFDPGNRVKRVMIALGAGRSVLQDAVTFRDGSGKVLAEFSGGKSVTGMEYDHNPILTDNEDDRMTMITAAVRQIGDFIVQSGRDRRIAKN